MFNATLESPGGLIDGPTLMIVATRSRVVDHRLPSSILTARIYLKRHICRLAHPSCLPRPPLPIYRSGFYQFFK